MTAISIRLEDKDKQALDEMCAEMGMSVSTFFTIYAKRALRERRIPFEIAASEPEITREGALRAFQALRAEARANGVSDLTIDEINAEIRQARQEREGDA